MSIVFSSSEELTAEERRTFYKLLKRVTARAAGATIAVEPEDPTGEHQFFMSVKNPIGSFDPKDPRPELEEFRRRLAHPEEFVEFEECSITVKDR